MNLDKSKEVPVIDLLMYIFTLVFEKQLMYMNMLAG